jgi:SAM-dependent methyltransferase
VAAVVSEPGPAPDDLAATARALHAVLPPALAPVVDAAFIRSTVLYDEFVHRLTLRLFRESGLEAASRVAGTREEIARRAGLNVDRARVPVDWILRQLAARQVLEADPAGRFALRDQVPDLDPAPVREAQRRHDPSWLPAYVLAETVAADYPAFFRGAVAGEDVLFAPRRLRLWIDYFSNDNGLYAVSNRIGAMAAADWLPPGPGAILELGGGLGSGAVALLERLAAVGRLADLREYRFTELVGAFLRRGRSVVESSVPGLPSCRFDALDMNRPFAEQGVAPGSATVVYAVNTLHVAHDLSFTLAEVVRTLEPGGRLVASECMRPWPGLPLYVEFIFNLMETFRAPRLHPDYRPNGGFLTPEQWRRALEGAGFVDVRFLPDIERLREHFPKFNAAAVGATRPA